MRVFVFEYFSGGGCTGMPMVASLLAEGDMMLSAVAADLLKSDASQVMVMRDPRLERPHPSLDVYWVEGDWRMTWRECLSLADAVLPIAPETDGILEALCREVQRSGCLLLNSNARAVALATSKRQTLQALRWSGVPAVDFCLPHQVAALPPGALVVKPDTGVGCQGVRVLSGAEALAGLLAQEPRQDWLIQPYVEGTAISLSLLVGGECVCLLGANLQRVVQVDDRLELLGCVVNGWRGERAALLELAQAVCKAIPGLFGYVGIDLVITEQGPLVLEVNPRITTSYVGLSRSTGINVAEHLLHLATHPRELPEAPRSGKSVHVDLELGRVA